MNITTRHVSHSLHAGLKEITDLDTQIIFMAYANHTVRKKIAGKTNCRRSSNHFKDNRDPSVAGKFGIYCRLTEIQTLEVVLKAEHDKMFKSHTSILLCLPSKRSSVTEGRNNILLTELFVYKDNLLYNFNQHTPTQTHTDAHAY